MSITEQQVKQQLQKYQDPYLACDLFTAGAIKQISINDTQIVIQVVLGFPLQEIQQNLVQNLQKILLELPQITQVDIHCSYQIKSHIVQNNLSAVPGVKNVIAIGSGKGGVGKSTTCTNLAIALQQQGARVGLLDADIYGPNQPHMLGAQLVKPEIQENKKFHPVECYGLQTMSIGYLLDITTPAIWRGPMVSTALQQLVRDTLWDHLDYLLIDLPPGTGDIQLTLAQKIPVSGAVIVTTPQDVALLDARKGLEMFRKVNVSVLGVIENMSTHYCAHCGHQEHIFGQGGGQRIAELCQVSLLGQLPLAAAIRESMDQGCPIVTADPTGAIASAYKEVARKLSAKLSLQKVNFAAKFPQIVVEN